MLRKQRRESNEFKDQIDIAGMVAARLTCCAISWNVRVSYKTCLSSDLK